LNIELGVKPPVGSPRLLNLEVCDANVRESLKGLIILESL
jgi:hypothetical protein